MLHKSRYLIPTLLSVLCCACFEREVTTELAPVTSGVASERPSYVVQEGDTLFSIAWKFDKDHKALAYYNHLDPNAALHVGQTINLVSTKTTLAHLKEKNESAVAKSSALKSNIKSVDMKSAKIKSHESQVLASKNSSSLWYWPSKGQVSESFSVSQHNKGINIEGIAGSPVLASQAGIVAYSGNGLRGYGNLVILRHDNGYLSAYAFNQNIVVKEGEKVKAQQKIAEMGKRKGNKGQLHFEIRMKGRPVDPIKFLVRH